MFNRQFSPFVYAVYLFINFYLFFFFFCPLLFLMLLWFYDCECFGINLKKKFAI